MTYKSKRALEEKYDISASLTNKLLDEMRQIYQKQACDKAWIEV